MDNIFTIAKTGVAVGRESSGTEETPLFQSAIETKFKKLVDMGTVEIDTQTEPWTGLTGNTTSGGGTLATLAVKTIGSSYADRGRKGLNYYVFEDGHVKFEGAISFDGIGSDDRKLTATPLPEEYRPAHPVHFICPGESGNLSTTVTDYPRQLVFGYIGTDGHVHIRQVWSFRSTSTDTSTNHWCDIRAQWWI